MNTTVLTAPASESVTAVARPRIQGARIPLLRLVRVELRKMFDTRSGFWLMASIGISALLATAAVIVFAPDADQTYASFGSAVGMPMAVILPIVAILSVTSEWSQRSGLTTFTLVPSRGRVMAAKGAAAVLVVVSSAAAAGAAGSAAAPTPAATASAVSRPTTRRVRTRQGEQADTEASRKGSVLPRPVPGQDRGCCGGRSGARTAD